MRNSWMTSRNQILTIHHLRTRHINMPKEMNIAFFGSSLLSAYWNGAATYYRGIIRALNMLGHRTTFFEPDAFDRQAHRDIDEPDWARVNVYSAASKIGVQNA